MIKAQELRIGNLVRYFLGNDRIFQVTEISEFGLGVKNEDEDTWMQFKKFSSIPLTEEWLKRFGFESLFASDPQVQPSSKIYRKGEFEVYQPIENSQEFVFDYWRTDGALEIDHIHQLQNLFYSLIGEELTLTPNHEQ